MPADPRGPFSHVCTFAPDTGEERVVCSTPEHFEAPNWSPDGAYLLLNSRGRLWRLPLTEGAEPAPVDTGGVAGINNDHGISPDGTRYVISAGPMYVLPAGGGEPRRVTEKTPSYYHGWSPDGATLAYCAQRDGVFNLYAVPAAGGEEVRLTFGGGYDDGPDYSPDGRWVYFNSNRTGNWCIWRVPAGGSGGPGDPRAEQITGDDHEDWFPHPSPDGRWLLFLSYPKGTQGHPPGRDVVLRRMPLPGAEPGASPGPVRELKRLHGGQGTVNVNSWSPDSRHFAFVRYEPRPEG